MKIAAQQVMYRPILGFHPQTVVAARIVAVAAVAVAAKATPTKSEDVVDSAVSRAATNQGQIRLCYLEISTESEVGIDSRYIQSPRNTAMKPDISRNSSITR
jgi:hypothetical protein